MKPKYRHHDRADRLAEGRRDALGAYGLVGLSKQSDDAVAKFGQGTSPNAAGVRIQCQGRARRARTALSASWRHPGHVAGASCPSRCRKAHRHSVPALAHRPGEADLRRSARSSARRTRVDRVTKMFREPRRVPEKHEEVPTADHEQSN